AGAAGGERATICTGVAVPRATAAPAPAPAAPRRAARPGGGAAGGNSHRPVLARGDRGLAGVCRDGRAVDEERSRRREPVVDDLVGAAGGRARVGALRRADLHPEILLRVTEWGHAQLVRRPELLRHVVVFVKLEGT